MSSIFRASKNISGLVKVMVTSPAGLMKFFLNVEPWTLMDFSAVLTWSGIKRNKKSNVQDTFQTIMGDIPREIQTDLRMSYLNIVAQSVYNMYKISMKNRGGVG